MQTHQLLNLFDKIIFVFELAEEADSLEYIQQIAEEELGRDINIIVYTIIHSKRFI